MEGSSSGNNGSGDPDFEMFCFCGKPTPLRKSGTEKNPGRRFFGCANYKTWIVVFFAGMSLLFCKKGLI
ncbi:hypothetical protein RHGRI_014100 [Rhododendron griersonianum]|uniref:Zinc finger GRF-type domain-containing protein n=1 Tax=Rhododendron griersonianum TaxID=479676 RepID=A0AAV6K840_9ERIC|nr:hypothetical protein RHGRI_014100 [Rhododendron griersonianum]